MASPIVIESVSGFDSNIFNDLSRRDSMAVDNEVPADVARGVPFSVVPLRKLIGW